jgi:Cys-rich repeat protein
MITITRSFTLAFLAVLVSSVPGHAQCDPTTTTTTTSSTTISTGPTCANGGIACVGACGGACGNCVGPEGGCFSLVHCGSAQPVCAGSILDYTACTSDAQCPAGEVCVAAASGESQSATAHCGMGGNHNFCAAACPE